MRFSSNTAILGLVVISFICHVQTSYSSNNRRKSKPSVTTERNTNLEEIATGLTDIVDQSSSEEGVDILDVGIKVAEVVASLAPSPVGPLLSFGLTLFGMSKVGTEENKIKEALKANDEASKERDSLTQSMILEESKRLEGIIIAESFRVIKNLTDTFDLHPFMKTMRQQLEYLESKYSDNIACLLNSHCEGEAKDGALENMMNPFSDYRTILGSFISNFIEPKNRNLHKSYSENFFFDFLLHEVREKENNNKDCFSESIKTQIFKSYMFIAKILTDAYSIVATAHAVRYRQYSVQENVTNKIATTVSESVKVANNYRSHMKILMERTRKSLEEASGLIRKCDPNHFVKGESFDRLNFLKTGLVKKTSYKGLSHRTVEAALKNRKLWCSDTDITNDREILAKKEQLDIENSKSIRPTLFIETCLFHDKSQMAGFSSQSVDAQPGNVVTGIRWRIKNGIIYVDIEEGKFIDGTRVDEDTVELRETPESNEHIVFFNDDVWGILLEDVILKPGTYVTGVQMIAVNEKMTLSVKGSRTNPQGTKLTGEPFHIKPEKKKYSELVLDRPGHPETNLEQSESIVMRSQGQFYVNLQPIVLWKNDESENIPYFDIQDVLTDPPAPIGGLGIYHKAVKGYGGFVALKMISPDYSHMLNEKQLEKYTKMFQIKPKKGPKKN